MNAQRPQNLGCQALPPSRVEAPRTAQQGLRCSARNSGTGVNQAHPAHCGMVPTLAIEQAGSQSESSSSVAQATAETLVPYLDLDDLDATVSCRAAS